MSSRLSNIIYNISEQVSEPCETSTFLTVSGVRDPSYRTPREVPLCSPAQVGSPPPCGPAHEITPLWVSQYPVGAHRRHDVGPIDNSAAILTDFHVSRQSADDTVNLHEPSRGVTTARQSIQEYCSVPNPKIQRLMSKSSAYYSPGGYGVVDTLPPQWFQMLGRNSGQ
ncbi:hypothetical protein B0H13DRAFT_1887861 [Mycena leptocephala]|nr:hypothetical protein B0H13DRAFT_1887861 [Mycena leptocephala]